MRALKEGAEEDVLYLHIGEYVHLFESGGLLDVGAEVLGLVQTLEQVGEAGVDSAAQ